MPAKWEKLGQECAHCMSFGENQRKARKLFQSTRQSLSNSAGIEDLSSLARHEVP